MNKTVTINIAGFFFHIDEDAYEKLNNYLNAIKRSLNTEGKEEIISDVESRIAEIFNERIDASTGVVRMHDVDYVVQVMGQPEDYRLDEDDDSKTATSSASTTTQSRNKKLYRDGEKRILGGVLSGLGHYMNVDAVWLRIIFILLIFVYGLSIIVYPILWLIIPKARTTAEILEMKGEPVNLDTIERTIRENFNEMGERIKNIDTQRFKSAGTSAAEVIKKIIGGTFIFFGVMGIMGAFISSFTVFKLSNSQINGFPLKEIVAEGYPQWAASLTMFGLVFIPCFIIFLVGLKLLYKNIKYVGLVSIILGLVWAVCIVYFSIVMIDIDTKRDKVWKEIFLDNYKTTMVKKSLDHVKTDTLLVDFVRDPRFYGINDTLKGNNFYSEHQNVEIEVFETTQPAAYLEIKTKVFHKKNNKASISNTHIELETVEVPTMLDYYSNIQNNHIELANALIYTKTSDYIENSVKILLYLPQNKVIRINGNDRDFIENSNIQRGIQYYKFKDGYLDCTTCITNND